MQEVKKGEKMNQKSEFSVFSETGQLKQVMLHRPGREIDRLTIENMDELLFDDLLWLEQAQREHDNFAQILRDNGTEVLYFGKTLIMGLLLYCTLTMNRFVLLKSHRHL